MRWATTAAVLVFACASCASCADESTPKQAFRGDPTAAWSRLSKCLAGVSFLVPSSH